SLRVVGPRDRVRRYRLVSRAPAGLRLGSRVRFVIRGGRVSKVLRLSRAARIRFYGRVVKLSPRTSVLRLADGRRFRLGPAHGETLPRGVTRKRALQKGRTVLTTLTLSTANGVSVSISPVAPTPAAGS